MIHRFFLFGTVLLTSFSLSAQVRATSTISDSIDIRHIEIRLQVTDFAGQTITGDAKLFIVAKVDGIAELPLDLLALTVDSVIAEEETTLPFTHISERLNIELSEILNTGDSTTITVYYSGEPVPDGSWGGWYWSGDYSYQLGVGFDALPHNFGRVWFPCFDNFNERSTFRFEITTPGDKKAFCGGLLESEVTNTDGTKTWTWNLNQTIPSYLASVAVANYATVNMNYDGIERDIPIQLAVKPEDSTDLKNSFVNLQQAMAAYENYFGAYSWDRVGYAIVPFSGGAMEHAMNIAYPLFAVNGNTLYESLMAHELSHHWWGDLITCSSAQEMWLNEGWASYAEHLFTEYVYGTDAYNEVVKSNHTYVLHYVAQNDGGNYFALSDMPDAYTYSSTTYKKGADVIATLRNYMGDEDFFNCISSFLDVYKFQAVTAAQLKDHLSACSGTDLTSFFDNWIYAAGFPAFEVESISYFDAATINGICIEQKLKHAPAFFNDVPLTISFFDANWNLYHEESVIMSGEHSSFSFPSIPAPESVIIDYHEKISDAVTSNEIMMTTPGDYYFSNAFVTISPLVISDTTIIYGQQYWVEGDNYKEVIPGLHVNTQRYWKFQGMVPGDFQAEATIKYNGKTGVSGGNQDNEFISNIEDSLVLLYRPDASSDWTIYPDYTLNDLGPNNDKFGQFELSAFMLGEYALGMYNTSLPDEASDEIEDCSIVSVHELEEVFFNIYPNPAQHSFNIKFKNVGNYKIELFDSLGNKIFEMKPSSIAILEISTKELAAGSYEIKCTSVDNKLTATEKLVIIR